MEKAKKQYPSDAEITHVMAERKLNWIGAVQYLRRQSAKAITQPKELNKVLAKLDNKAAGSAPLNPETKLGAASLWFSRVRILTIRVCQFSCLLRVNQNIQRDLTPFDSN
jgi:hypothetical protein